MVESLDEKTPSASSGIEHSFSQTRIHSSHDELNHWARSIELTGIASRVSHLPQHRFVEIAERVNFILGGEVDSVDLVDYIAQQVAIHHPVYDTLKYAGNDIAAVAVRALKRAQISKQTCPSRPVGPGHLV